MKKVKKKMKKTSREKNISVLINDEMFEIFQRQEELFKDMYGRNPNLCSKSEEDLFIFWNVRPCGKEMPRDMIYGMRKVGINEATIYAVYRTGLIPVNDVNIKLIPRDQLDEFNAFYDDYEKAKRNFKRYFKKKSLPAFIYCPLTNQLIEDDIERIRLYFSCTANDFFRRHPSLQPIKFEYEIKDEIDFVGYCFMSMRKHNEAIDIFSQGNHVEAIYSVCRSLIEIYLFIASINAHKNFFAKKIMLDQDISLKYLAEHTPYTYDKQLYTVFYQCVCQFIHLDPLAAKNYFHDSDLYNELDPGIIGKLVATSIELLILEEVIAIRGIDALYKEDLIYLCNMAKRNLSVFFTAVMAVESCESSIFQIFTNRLEESRLTESNRQINIEQSFEESKKRESVELPEDLQNLQDFSHVSFIEMYGRDLAPDADPYSCNNFFSDMPDILFSSIPLLRKQNNDEEELFVYYRTGYWQNKAESDDEILTKIEEASTEFRHAMLPRKEGEQIPQLQLVRNALDIFKEFTEKHMEYIFYTSNDYIRRHIEKFQTFQNFQIKTPLDFIGFGLLKCNKDLQALTVLYQEAIEEEMFPILRSLYETYLYIMTIIVKPDFLNKVMDIIDTSNVQFTHDANGEVNYNSLIFDIKINPPIENIRSLAEESPFQEDIVLYELIFKSFSQFIHIKKNAAKYYFSVQDPFFTVPIDLIICLSAESIVILIFDMMTKSSLMQSKYRNDLRHLISKLKRQIDPLYEIIHQAAPANDLIQNMQMRVSRINAN